MAFVLFVSDYDNEYCKNKKTALKILNHHEILKHSKCSQ